MTADDAVTRSGFDPSRRRLLRGAAVAAGLGVSAFGMGKSTVERSLQPRPGLIPREYFGLHLHRADAGTPWPIAKFGSWRLWDAYVNWRHLEPQRDYWDFKKLDRYVAMAKLTGVELLLPLALTPQWASARPWEKSPYGAGNAAEPASLEDWRNYVRTVARRYKGRIRHYELWNEPNEPGFFSGTPQVLVRLTEEAYRILKDEDPGNVLVGPSAVGGGAEHLAWLDRYLGVGGGQFLDVLSHHYYVAHANPEAVLPLVDKVKAVAKLHGLSRLPLWNTEAGWWIDHSDGTVTPEEMVPGWKKLGAEEAAAYVSRALILGWAAGLERYYWFAWDNYDMGLIEPTTKAIKPAGEAYVRTLNWLVGTQMTRCELSDGVWGVSLIRPNGGKAWIVWAEQGGERRWAVPGSNWVVRATETLDGRREVLHAVPAYLVVGAKPVYLDGNS